MEPHCPSGLAEFAAPPPADRWPGVSCLRAPFGLWVGLSSSALLVALIAWIDWRVGWEISLFVFYALPISLAAWHFGAGFGYVVALWSAIAWWIAQGGGYPYETSYGLVLAFLNRMIFFGIAAFATTSVRNRRRSDEQRIRVLEELRQLEHDIVAVSEHEHQRIGQDLHDGICQQLAAVGCAVHALAEDLRSRSDPGAADAELIGRSLHRTVKDARQLAQGILPVHVDREGLAVALRRLAKTLSALTGAQVRLVDDPGFLVQDPGSAMHLYRIAQEAVSNAIRHGAAQNVTIFLNVEPKFQELRIDDDGRGFDPQGTAFGTGMGLRTMHCRVQTIPGCSLSFGSLSTGGTSVRCRFPIQAT